MLLSDFKAEIAALLNRAPAALVQNGQDLIVNMSNRGKRSAQRLLDFSALRSSVDVTVNLTDGVDLGTAVLHGTATPVSINRILEVYLQYTDASFLPIEFGTLSQYRNTVMRKLDERYYDVRQSQQQLLTPLFMPTWPTMFRQGNKVFLKPTQSQYFNNQTDVSVGLDVVRWDDDFQSATTVVAMGTEAGPFVTGGLASITLTQVGYLDGHMAFALGSDGNFLHFSQAANSWLLTKQPYNTSYAWVGPSGAGNLYGVYTGVGFSGGSLIISAGTTTIAEPADDNIFLNDCVEWLQLYVIQNLQTHFIKATDKWPVTKQMITDAWRNVVSWNESISEGEVSSNLD